MDLSTIVVASQPIATPAPVVSQPSGARLQALPATVGPTTDLTGPSNIGDAAAPTQSQPSNGVALPSVAPSMLSNSPLLTSMPSNTAPKYPIAVVPLASSSQAAMVAQYPIQATATTISLPLPTLSPQDTLPPIHPSSQQQHLERDWLHQYHRILADFYESSQQLHEKTQQRLNALGPKPGAPLLPSTSTAAPLPLPTPVTLTSATSSNLKRNSYPLPPGPPSKRPNQQDTHSTLPPISTNALPPIAPQPPAPSSTPAPHLHFLTAPAPPLTLDAAANGSPEVVLNLTKIRGMAIISGEEVAVYRIEVRRHKRLEKFLFLPADAFPLYGLPGWVNRESIPQEILKMVENSLTTKSVKSEQYMDEMRAMKQDMLNTCPQLPKWGFGSNKLRLVSAEGLQELLHKIHKQQGKTGVRDSGPLPKCELSWLEDTNTPVVPTEQWMAPIYSKRQSGDEVDDSAAVMEATRLDDCSPSYRTISPEDLSSLQQAYPLPNALAPNTYPLPSATGMPTKSPPPALTIPTAPSGGLPPLPSPVAFTPSHDGLLPPDLLPHSAVYPSNITLPIPVTLKPGDPTACLPTHTTPTMLLNNSLLPKPPPPQPLPALLPRSGPPTSLDLSLLPFPVDLPQQPDQHHYLLQQPPPGTLITSLPLHDPPALPRISSMTSLQHLPHSSFQTAMGAPVQQIATSIAPPMPPLAAVATPQYHSNLLPDATLQQLQQQQQQQQVHGAGPQQLMTSMQMVPTSLSLQALQNPLSQPPSPLLELPLMQQALANSTIMPPASMHLLHTSLQLPTNSMQLPTSMQPVISQPMPPMNPIPMSQASMQLPIMCSQLPQTYIQAPMQLAPPSSHFLPVSSQQPINLPPNPYLQQPLLHPNQQSQYPTSQHLQLPPSSLQALTHAALQSMPMHIMPSSLPIASSMLPAPSMQLTAAQLPYQLTNPAPLPQSSQSGAITSTSFSTGPQLPHMDTLHHPPIASACQHLPLVDSLSSQIPMSSYPTSISPPLMDPLHSILLPITSQVPTSDHHSSLLPAISAQLSQPDPSQNLHLLPPLQLPSSSPPPLSHLSSPASSPFANISSMGTMDLLSPQLPGAPPSSYTPTSIKHEAVAPAASELVASSQLPSSTVDAAETFMQILESGS